MRGVRVAALRVLDRDAVEAEQVVVGFPRQPGQFVADDGRDGVEVGRVVVVLRHDAEGRHAPLTHERLE